MDITACIDSINRALSKSTLGNHPIELYEPMQYMLDQDTHRKYALLTHWGCYLISGVSEKALVPSLGVEIFYNFLKVHEDLLDGSAQRNGIDSVANKWDDNVAILSGDAMVFKAYELLIQVEPLLIKTVVQSFNHCFIKVCEGKQLALNNPEIAESKEILGDNPGALAGFSLQLGALIAGAGRQQQDLIRKLGVELGINWGSANGQRNPDAFSSSLDLLDCSKDRKLQFKHWATA